jgi:lipopolysaccharide export system permease protein
MLILNRYIATQLTYMVGIASLLLMSIDLFFMLVNELRFIGHGAYDMGDAFAMILLAIPQKIYQWFPFALLLGTLLSLNQMSNNNELTAFRAHRFSLRHIVLALLKTGLVLSAFAFVLGEFVAPAFDRVGQNHRAVLLTGGQALATAQGTWMRDGKDYIHVRNMKVDGTLEGVTQYHFDEAFDLVEASHAQFAVYESGVWQLSNIQSTHLSADHIETQFQESAQWPTTMSPDTLRVASIKYLDQLSIQGLWESIRYRGLNSLDAKPYWLAFWKKITQPLSCLIMILVAVPFVFGSLRSATTGLRLLLGIAVGLFYHTLNAFFGPFTLLYGLPPFIGAVFPMLVFAAGAYWRMRKIY